VSSLSFDDPEYRDQPSVFQDGSPPNDIVDELRDGSISPELLDN